MLTLLGAIGPLPSAQAQVAAEIYELTFPEASVQVFLQANGEPASFQVPWVVACGAAASTGAAGPGTLDISLDGNLVELVNHTAAVTLPDCVLAKETQGIATFGAKAAPGVPGETPQRLAIHTTLRAPAVPDTAGDPKLALVAIVTWTGAFEVSAPVTDMTAGPQKQISYEVHITNRGNGRAIYDFAVGDKNPGWQPVLPSPVIVEPGQTSRVNFVLSTPYHNGSNSGEATWHLNVTSRSTKNSVAVGDTHSLEFHSGVHGVYIPGPSPALLLLGLAALVVLVRRQR